MMPKNAQRFTLGPAPQLCHRLALRRPRIVNAGRAWPPGHHVKLKEYNRPKLATLAALLLDRLQVLNRGQAAPRARGVQDEGCTVLP